MMNTYLQPTVEAAIAAAQDVWSRTRPRDERRAYGHGRGARRVDDMRPLEVWQPRNRVA